LLVRFSDRYLSVEQLVI